MSRWTMLKFALDFVGGILRGIPSALKGLLTRRSK